MSTALFGVLFNKIYPFLLSILRAFLIYFKVCSALIMRHMMQLLAS